jgi:catechol 2,3-dioxygenase-like lactoylglutathione lyase family enzyme
LFGDLKIFDMKPVPALLVITACLVLPIHNATAQAQQARPAFNHIYLGVHNIDSSIAFYTKAFDLRVTYRISQLDITQTDSAFKRAVNIAFLKFPGQDLVYELGERSDKGDTTIKTGNLYQHVGVEIKDVTATLKRVLEAGGKLAVPIRQVRTNAGLTIKQAVVKGPDGESIELVEIISGEY